MREMVVKVKSVVVDQNVLKEIIFSKQTQMLSTLVSLEQVSLRLIALALTPERKTSKPSYLFSGVSSSTLALPTPTHDQKRTMPEASGTNASLTDQTFYRSCVDTRLSTHVQRKDIFNPVS